MNAYRTGPVSDVVSAVDELPDPPDNPEFLNLPIEFQDDVSDRFDRGVALTRSIDDYWAAELFDTAQSMRNRRAAFEAKIRVQRDAARVRERANKASLGDYVRFRADNSGSEK